MKKTVLIILLICFFISVKAQTGVNLDSVYSLYSAQINSWLEITAADRLNEIRERHRLLPEFLDSLTAIVSKREKSKLIIDYAYPTSHYFRFSEKQKVDSMYSDAIDRLLLLSGNDLSSPNLYLALRGRFSLKLTDGQADTLAALALKHKKALAKNPRRDLWRQELEVLETTLNEWQFEFFFTLKNRDKMLRETSAAWRRLQEAGLTADLDSASACGMIYRHKMKIQKASDIYTYEDAKKREAWAAIDFHAPVPVKRIYSINRKNSAKKQGYRGNFMW